MTERRQVDIRIEVDGDHIVITTFREAIDQPPDVAHVTRMHLSANAAVQMRDGLSAAIEDLIASLVQEVTDGHV